MSWMGMTSLAVTGIIWVTLGQMFLKTLVLKYFVGEYIKDLDNKIMPQDPILQHKIPIPLMEKGHCSGVWNDLEASWYDTGDNAYLTNRDCGSFDPSDFVQPLSASSSKVFSKMCKSI